MFVDYIASTNVLKKFQHVKAFGSCNFRLSVEKMLTLQEIVHLILGL